MRKLIILLSIFLGGISFGCFNEDDIHVEEQHYKRVYDTTSTDPVWKFVSDYYYTTGKLFITDPDVSDYVFNFQNKYALWLLQPEQTEEHLLKGIRFVEELFLNGYSDEFKRKFFPFKIILADSVVYTGSLSVGEEWQPRDVYATDDHLSFSISEHVMNITEEEKKAFSVDLNYTFITGCGKKMGWEVPGDFYLYSTEEEFLKNATVTTTEVWTNENFWELGYPSGKPYERYMYDEATDKWGWVTVGYQFAATKDGYKEQFIRFLFLTPSEEVDRIIATYPKMKKAHDVLDQSLKDYLGIDYRNIGYKAKK